MIKQNHLSYIFELRFYGFKYVHLPIYHMNYFFGCTPF